MDAFESHDLRALGGSLISDELIVFPVRHHSPACALHLRRLMAACKPSAVLVEGPRSFTPLIQALTDARAEAPLALYTYTVHKDATGEERRLAAYYPFCDYSPELVALREACRLGVEAHFIDLDFAEQSLLDRANIENEARTLLDERHYWRSQHLQALATRLGCRDHEELWEHLFESMAPALALEEHVTRMAAYCALARYGLNDAALAADGTLQREAEMAWHVQQALTKREKHGGPVLVVVGGFHAVALPGLLAQPVARPRISTDGVSDAASALIRYSFDRLDRLNGYGAGMASPAWHQRLWRRQLKQERVDPVDLVRQRKENALEVLSEIADILRNEHGLPVPVPALAAAYEQALRLAQLRVRPAPLREDVLDAVTSCFIKGDVDLDGVIVRSAAQRVMCGNALGKVPPGVGAPPLVKDFELRARRQRLKIEDSERRKLVLDIYRRPEHRITSRLLHGLVLLAIPFATRMAGPDFARRIGLERLQEHWEYGYSPASEAALVEASVFGVTVPLAVANRFMARLDAMKVSGEGRNAKTAASALVLGCQLGLHDHLGHAVVMLRSAIADDALFTSVSDAVTAIALLWEAREPLEARELGELPELLKRAYERAIYLASEIKGSTTDQGDVVTGLLQLRELLTSEAGATLDASIYWQMVEGLYLHHGEPQIRGASAGLLYSAGRIADADVESALGGHLNSLLAPQHAVAFVRGLFQTARELAWQLPAVLQVLDGLLRQWDEGDFVSNLPELRLAFASMTPKETDRIAAAVAQLHGTEDLGPLVSHALSEQQLQANLRLSQTVQAILAEDGLGDWGMA
ncbi:MAG: hypothetical protein JO142_01980 [Burkholderiales bacterium]|nr:hypothetical protein [Burkholderiales bacterium]